MHKSSTLVKSPCSANPHSINQPKTFNPTTCCNSEPQYHILSSLKMISDNHRPDYCRDFSRNGDSVKISDEITDSLVSLLKISNKNKIFNTVESLYYLKENQKGRKRSDTRIHYKLPTKTFEGGQSPKCGKLRRACVHAWILENIRACLVSP